MANKEHLDILEQGVNAWNSFRETNTSVRPDLSKAELSKTNLTQANLSRADLTEAILSRSFLNKADLTEATLDRAILFRTDLNRATLRKVKLKNANLNRTNLVGANLEGADLSEATLVGADLSHADLSGAFLYKVALNSATLDQAKLVGATLVDCDLIEATLINARLQGSKLSGTEFSNADLWGADLTDANLMATSLMRARLTEANLTGACLEFARLVETNLEGANLTGSYVYGIAVWNIRDSKETCQKSLVISRSNDRSEPLITVDDIEVAQFVYLLLNNEKLRDVIETMTSKAVLILGNFTPERKEVLEAIRERLRELGYLPILFDFQGPKSRNIVETVTAVARLSRFVIADITQPRSIPDELRTIVPAIKSLPVKPVIEEPEVPYATFSDLVESDSVLNLHHYRDLGDLLESFSEEVIAPLEQKVKELEMARLIALQKLY